VWQSESSLEKRLSCKDGDSEVSQQVVWRGKTYADYGAFLYSPEYGDYCLRCQKWGGKALGFNGTRSPYRCPECGATSHYVSANGRWWGLLCDAAHDPNWPGIHFLFISKDAEKKLKLEKKLKAAKVFRSLDVFM
jgi:hypothetical protein